MSSLRSFTDDYETLTQACGLLDRSERGKLALTGADVKVFLQGQVSNDVEALTPGTGLYAAFLTPKGKMLGDLRILDAGLVPVARSASGLAETGDARVVQLLLLDTERSSLQELFNMIRRFSLGYDVELHKRTLQSGLISLIGPSADAVCGAVGATPPPPEEHAHVETPLARAIRTDVGIDLLFPADTLDTVRDAVVAGGALEVSEEAAECLRIETGRPRYGVDLDDRVIPQEAGLNQRAVSFTKGCYVGQETVARLFYRGKPNRHLRGLRAAHPLTPGTELHFEDRSVGQLTSAVVSPRFGPIGLAFVRREVEPGATVSLGSEATAEVVELPFA